MIIINNEDKLRVNCDLVILEEYENLKNSLEKELNQANRLGKAGIGLAAPQIGIAKKMAIIRLPKITLDLVNCKIEKGYDPAIFKDEGCLSFPGKIQDTIRFQEIYVTNNLVEPHSFVATGLLAVACQHEIDHYNSILFTDHLVPNKTQNTKWKEPGPNDKCFCNSGKKYKKCCKR